MRGRDACGAVCGGGARVALFARLAGRRCPPADTFRFRRRICRAGAAARPLRPAAARAALPDPTPRGCEQVDKIFKAAALAANAQRIPLAKMAIQGACAARRLLRRVIWRLTRAAGRRAQRPAWACWRTRRAARCTLRAVASSQLTRHASAAVRATGDQGAVRVRDHLQQVQGASVQAAPVTPQLLTRCFACFPDTRTSRRAASSRMTSSRASRRSRSPSASSAAVSTSNGSSGAVMLDPQAPCCDARTLTHHPRIRRQWCRPRTRARRPSSSRWWR